MKKLNVTKLVIVAALSTAALLIAAAMSLGKNSAERKNFKAARLSEKTVIIEGEWVNKERAVNAANSFTFFMEDLQGNVAEVKYYDPMPLNFPSVKQFAVQGKFKSGVFEADKIFLKCPSKYDNATPEGLDKETANR